MKLWAVAIALLLIAVPAFAADVDGKWTGSVSTPNGDFEQTFVLKADGDKLTGTMTSLDGTPVAISGGTIAGSNITFSVTLDFGGMPFTLSYKGVVTATEIKLNGEAAGMPFELVVKKAV